MKINIFLTVSVPVGKPIEVPNVSNPYECETWAEAMGGCVDWCASMEANLGLEVVGIRLEQVI